VERRNYGVTEILKGPQCKQSLEYTLFFIIKNFHKCPAWAATDAQLPAHSLKATVND